MDAGVAPSEALERLIDGNKRFLAADLQPASKLEERREMLVAGPSPHTAILACADSRVIPNYIFLQGLSDLFVVRVAGNYPDDLVLASIEFAVAQLGTRLIMVLGHQSCGAVHAVYNALATTTPLPKNLSILEELMGPGIAPTVREKGTEDQAVRANVRAAVDVLRRSPPVLESAVKSGHVQIVGAKYQLEDGAVTLVE